VWVYAEAECSTFVSESILNSWITCERVKDNIEINSKEMAVMTTWNESKLVYIYISASPIWATIPGIKRGIFDQFI
jgi:hypothetical protein